jgi:predicted transcriptional regulator of viral defense system
MNKKPDYDLLYSIAEAQAGYFTARQAGQAGFSHERLSDLTMRGKFIRVQYGIYRLVHFPASRFEDMFIAHLRTGPASVISHESALAVYELSDVLPATIHVIIPRTASRRRKGIKLHTNQLQADEITQRDGLPVTTPARTIADVISDGLSFQLVKQAIIEALQRNLTNRQELLNQAERRKGSVAETIERVLHQNGS